MCRAAGCWYATEQVVAVFIPGVFSNGGLMLQQQKLMVMQVASVIVSSGGGRVDLISL